MSEPLTDIKIDFQTGKAVIDPETNDAVIIAGHEVILQDAYIRLKSQTGQIKRQNADGVGWDLYSKIKSDADLAQIQSIAGEMERALLTDERLTRAKVIPGDFINDAIQYIVTLKIEDDIYSFTYIL